MKPTPGLSGEARAVVRNVGLLLAGFALLMLAWSAFVGYGGMLWMDLPMLALGLALLGYAWRDGRRAPAS